jgi:hypothetical protein
MTKDQALPVLNGGLLPGPDVAQELERQWMAFRDRTQKRPKFQATTPVVKSPSAAIQRQLSVAASRPDIQASLAPHQWELGVVDLSVPILTYQSIIQIESAADRVAGAKPNDWQALIEICLPAPTEAQFEGGFDPVQNAFTISSLNPNLRVMSFEVVDAVVGGPSPAAKKVFGFTIGLGGSYVQFIEYQNRWMVRDGHHRLYGLLKAGITAVPAVLIRARSFEETGAGRPGFFGYEQLFGATPPLFADYVSDEFSAEVPVRAIRKVVRLRAEEYAILV